MRQSGLLCALLLAAACKTSDISDPSVTTSVQVSSNPTQIAVGETAQASAVVKDQNGNPISGKTVQWSSLNQSIATVTADGVIRGVAPGNATIQGTVEGITGSAAIQVVATSAVCANGPTTVDLAVGQVRVLSSLDTQGCVKIASAAAASEYIVIAANLNATPDVMATFTLRSDQGETLPAGTVVTTPFRFSSVAGGGSAESAAMQEVFESRLRQTERRELSLSRAQRSFADGTLPRLSANAAIPAIGDKTQFRVPKSCTDFKTVTGTVRYISTRAIIYTDDTSPSGGFTDPDFQEIGREFDDLIYPTDVDYFGTPLDLDANSRVVLFYTPEVNKLTPPSSPDGFVGGFAFAGDLFPTSSCPQANRAEILYLLAPDPAGTINQNPRAVSQVKQGTRGTIAHELQHMINASERIRHPVTDQLEAIWLDEALAHYAEDLNGRALRQLTETGNYTFEQLTNNGTQFNDYNAFFFQNFARLNRWMQNPGPYAATSSLVDSSLAVRGAAWALLRYAADHYAPGGDIKAFIRSLVPGPDTGVVNLRSKASGVSFDSLAAGWLVSNYADDLGTPNLAVKHTYRTYNMRSNVARVNTPNQTFPLSIAEVQGASQSSSGLQVRSGSGRYFRMARPAGGLARIFRFTNSDLTTAASFSGAALIVVRTQ
jgi:hypothetical protein